jgi:lipoic acid synthetase
LPVVEFVTPEKFVKYGRLAEEMGFTHVASGPMVRSSYHADEFEVPGKARMDTARQSRSQALKR